MRVYSLQAEKLITEQGERVYSPNNKPKWGDVTDKPDLAMLQAIRNKSQFEQMRQQNSDLYAASGFVHPGKHRDNGTTEVPINEGLFTATYGNYSNTLFMGNANQFKVGESKQDFAVIQISGIVSNLLGFSDSYQFKYTLPEAPDGTVVYDSTGDCRGTGKPNLDLSKEVDPKYGTVAENKNEAVARAFEGVVKNGDFRLGDDGSWPAPNNSRGTVVFDGQSMAITNTVRVNSNSSSGTMCVVQNSLTENVGTKIFINVEILSGTGTRVYVKAGSPAVSDLTITETGTYEIVVSPTGKTLYLYVGGDGVDDNVVKFESVSVQPITEEVVTERVDLVGLEFYLEEVTQANPFVYPNGCIQSQATTMNGIATDRSNRPDTYYAVYDGDISSAGKGVDFWAATTEQKIAMVSDASNNLFNFGDDLVPKIVQWRVRQRSIAGLGNLDWNNINPSVSSLMYELGESFLTTQGNKDSTSVFADVGAGRYVSPGNVGNVHGGNASQGVFVPVAGEVPATNEECYFYTVATVPRLNQGAYHPSLNPLGTRAHVVDTPGGQSSSSWYASNARKPKTQGNCFELASYEGATGYARDTTGYIGHAGVIGRPDGRFYDAIYASGLGGVIDHRLKYGAWDASRPEQASKVVQEVVSGKYRGVEKLKYTSNIITSGRVGGTRNDKYFLLDVGDNTDRKYSWITSITIKAPTDSHGTVIVGGEVKKVIGTAKTGDKYIVLLCKGEVFTSTEGEPVSGCFGYYKHSVSGKLNQNDVIGPVDQISTIPELKDGWLGSWGFEYDDVKAVLTRDLLSDTTSVCQYYENGTWHSTNRSFDSIGNTVNVSEIIASNRVWVVNYPIFAKQTKQSVNKKVLNSSSGLLNVWASSHFSAGYGAVFGESLIGKVNTNSVAASAGIFAEYKPLDSFMFWDTDVLPTGSWIPTNSPKHAPLRLTAPNNNSGAYKILPHQVEDNHQASLNFIANELKHNGTDWGDDNTIKVIENGTYTNENSETCLADIHTLTFPYGYIRQK